MHNKYIKKNPFNIFSYLTNKENKKNYILRDLLFKTKSPNNPLVASFVD